jgi:hypothetical protein
MQKFYHGTSADNLKYILRDGFLINSSKLWSASQDGIYFWSGKELAETDYDPIDYQSDKDNWDRQAKERAYESAQIAIAVSKDCRCVVFEVELNEDQVLKDESCPNMDGAVVIYRDVKPSEIKRVFISPDLSLLKGYFINMARNMELFAHSFNETELLVANIFKKAEIYPEIMEDFPLEDYSILDK